MDTAFTRMFGLRHPIASAPMGGSAGGALAAAVARGGGLGLVGGGDVAWLDRELPLAAAAGAAWGVGFLTWSLDDRTLDRALEYAPPAVMLSFGDPGRAAGRVRGRATLIVQVTDLDEARRAVDVGADLIVAQGTESGGHGALCGRSTFTFVPAVVDLVAPVPVLAAGGVADGRGVAAALMLGAAGALVGTRFQASAESLAHPSIVRAIVAGTATERSRVLDIARESAWPARYSARTVGHPFLDAWRGREAELAADADARRAYADAVARGDVPPLPVWAGEAVALIDDVPSATELVERLGAQARTRITEQQNA